MIDHSTKRVWPYWTGIIAIISVYVVVQNFDRPNSVDSNCDHLKEMYLINFNGMQIATAIQDGGRSVAEARVRLELARIKLVEECGQSAPLEAEKYYYETNQVLFD